MADALDYLAAAIADRIRSVGNDDEISSLAAIKSAFKKYGTMSDDVAEAVARRLEYFGFLQRVTDKYAGTYFIPISGLNLLLRMGTIREDKNSSVFLSALGGGDRLFQRVFANNEFWQDVATDIENIDSKNSQIVEILEVPAADRIVSLTHNQQLELESSSTELVDVLARENAIDGDGDLRDRLLGQVRAARELIRAQSIRAYLLHETVMTVLTSLIERYQDQAIGQAAKKLLDLLIEHIFGH